jgi:hypothetical protein
MLRCLRLLAIAVGVGVSIGETIRSWGVHRPIFAVVDDYVMAVFLVAAALWRNRPGTYALLSAAFGFSSGMLYGSFFLHLSLLSQPDPGKIPQTLLTFLIGLAFFGSVLGLALALRGATRQPSPEQPVRKSRSVV